MKYHTSKEHPQREFPAMATIELCTVVESNDEFEDFLNTARKAMARHSRWAYAQGHHPTANPDGITYEEAEVKLNWKLLRLDKWRTNQKSRSHFYQILAFVKPYDPVLNQPFMTVYARDSKDRDDLVQRFEQDNLEVRVNIVNFYERLP